MGWSDFRDRAARGGTAACPLVFATWSARAMNSSRAIEVAQPSGAHTRCAASVDTPGTQFFHSGGMRWRLLRAGQGPRVLLLHGTGSDCESWARLTTALADHFAILAPDLPGHGASGVLPRSDAGLDRYAAAVGALVRELSAWPDIIVGHSAGAAIAARMVLDATPASSATPALISLNGALRPLSGWTAATFVPLAKLVGINAAVPGLIGSLLAKMVAGDPYSVRRLLKSTGSRVDAGMIAHYEQLMRNSAHLAGTLRMLAQWDLRGLVPDLHALGARLTLVAGEFDRTVPVREAHWVHGQVPGSSLVALPGLGHLAHEEAPDAVARIVLSVAHNRGLLDGVQRAQERA